MRQMKESGIEWIGKIPEKWDFKRLKNVLKERKENNNPVKTNNILSLTNDRGVIPYSEKGNHGNKAKEDLSGYKLAYKGDIVMNSMNVIIGSVGLSSYFGCVSPVYYMLYTDKYNIKYFNYIFQSKVFQNELKGLGNGILEIRMRIPMEKLNNVILPIPPKNEQEKIANCLDEKITEIDSVIQKTKETIEDYKKYKQAVISKLILNNNYPKKIIKLKNVAKRITDGAHISPETENGVYDFISTVNLDNDIIDFNNCLKTSKNSYETMVRTGCKPDKGDILISKDGTVGKSVVVNEGYEFVVASSLVIVKLREDMAESEYINYVIKSDFVQEQLNSYMHGAGLKRVSVEKNANLKIVYIDKKYQKDIINHLEKVCKKIDALINNKGKILKELEQYKSALIYEYVTGKKEVV